MTYVKQGTNFLLAVRRPWELSRIHQSLYFAVRKARGITKGAIAAEVGVSYGAWRYRERMKEQYRLPEVLALKELSGLDWKEFGALIESCC